MEKIIWSDSYVTGIAEIDKQHRFLVNRINELIELKNYNEESANIYPILLLFIGYAQFHFDYEENFFIKSIYSRKGEHIEEHHNFAKFIDSFNEAYISGSRDIDNELISFLYDWWTHHITVRDMEFINEIRGAQNGD